MRAWGIKSSASFLIRFHVIRAFWLRRWSERRQRSVTRCRNLMSARLFVGTAIFKEAGYDLPQPFPLFGERLMPTPSHFLLDFLEPRLHAVATAFRFNAKRPRR